MREILDFWFGELGDDGNVVEDRSALWWKKSPATDASIRERFEGDVEGASARGIGWYAARNTSPIGWRGAALAALTQIARSQRAATGADIPKIAAATRLEELEVQGPGQPLLSAGDLRVVRPQRRRLAARVAAFQVRLAEHGG